MSPTITQTLADIRARSAETWRIAALPTVDPRTGVPKPLRIVSHADEDVKFLLERLDEAYNDITQFEDLLAAKIPLTSLSTVPFSQQRLRW